MEITNPRRILLLTPAPPRLCLAPLFKVFPTPTTPSSHSTSISQTSKPSFSEPPSFPEIFPIQTAYYTAHIPLWHTSLPEDIPAWKQEWLDMEGAGEVVREIGAWIVGFEKPDRGARELEDIRNMLQAIHAILRYHMGEIDPYDGAESPLLLAVGLPGKGSGPGVDGDEWDDLCRECGDWEYIDGCIEERGKRNEYGETLGLPRLVEALEANEWDSSASVSNAQDGSTSPPSLPLHGLSSEDETDSPDASPVDILWEAGPGLRKPLLETSKDRAGQDGEQGGGGDEVGEEDVAELERLMVRMQAVREHSTNLPPTARKAFAARAVKGIMGSS